jgi:hypothetical protein
MNFHVFAKHKTGQNKEHLQIILHLPESIKKPLQINATVLNGLFIEFTL